MRRRYGPDSSRCGRQGDTALTLAEIYTLSLVGHPFCFDMFGPLCDTSLSTETPGRSEPWARKPSTSSD